jgi:hypothetical protein
MTAAVVTGLLVLVPTACGGDGDVRPAATTEEATDDTEAPGTTEPGTTEPGTTEPGTTEPGTTEPDDGGGAASEASETDGDPMTSAVLEDGRHPVYLVELDVPRREVTFDLIQFLTGDEAITAYREDTPEDPEGDPPNDYFIRNVNPQLRTLPVADDVAATVVRLGEASGAGSVPSSFEELPAHLDEQPAADGRLAWNPYWLTVEQGEIVAIDEQYLP